MRVTCVINTVGPLHWSIRNGKSKEKKNGIIEKWERAKNSIYWRNLVYFWPKNAYIALLTFLHFSLVPLLQLMTDVLCSWPVIFWLWPKIPRNNPSDIKEYSEETRHYGQWNKKKILTIQDLGTSATKCNIPTVCVSKNYLHRIVERHQKRKEQKRTIRHMQNEPQQQKKNNNK